MIDLHSHILPGIDDGPDRVAHALDMARTAAADGADAMVCTPHRAAHYPNTREIVAAGIAALQPAIDAEGIALRLLPGMEITIGQLAAMDDDELRAVSLGGGGRWLLVEMPFRGWPLELPRIVDDLAVRGFGVVLAHPERADAIQRSPDRLRDIVGRGVLCQITAGSVSGELGNRPQRTAIGLLQAGFAHFIASDAHAPAWRPPGLRAGLEAAADALRTSSEELEWMVDEGPRLVVEGKDVRPPRLAPVRTLRGVAPRAQQPGRRPRTRG